MVGLHRSDGVAERASQPRRLGVGASLEPVTKSSWLKRDRQTAPVAPLDGEQGWQPPVQPRRASNTRLRSRLCQKRMGSRLAARKHEGPCCRTEASVGVHRRSACGALPQRTWSYRDPTGFRAGRAKVVLCSREREAPAARSRTAPRGPYVANRSLTLDFSSLGLISATSRLGLATPASRAPRRSSLAQGSSGGANRGTAPSHTRAAPVQSSRMGTAPPLGRVLTRLAVPGSSRAAADEPPASSAPPPRPPPPRSGYGAAGGRSGSLPRRAPRACALSGRGRMSADSREASGQPMRSTSGFGSVSEAPREVSSASTVMPEPGIM